MTMPRSTFSASWGSDVVYADGTINGYASLVDAVLEYVPELYWPTAGDVLNQMRNDGQIAGSLRAYTLPIRRAPWMLDATGCRPSVTKLIADDLGLPVMNQEPRATGARRRRVVWSEHLRVALLDGVFGHMPFEQTYDTSTGVARLARLQERMPKTIERIVINGDGEIDYVEQTRVGMQIEAPRIPANALVWYVNEREGLGWRGRSLMRASYPYWQIKNLMLRVHAAFLKKAGMGVPYAQIPAGADPRVIAEADRAIANYQASETAHLTLPDGVKAGIAGITGSMPDTIEFIRYLDSQMSVSFLTQWLNLGTTEAGNRALAEVFVDMFNQSLQDFGDQHADQATAQIVIPLVDVNFGENEPAPKIVCGNVGANHAITTRAIYDLYSCGALTSDPEIENAIRELYKFPRRDPNAPIAAPSLKERRVPDYEPQYRFRGSVQPSAEVSRPVAARRTPAAVQNAAGSPKTGTSATLDIFDVIDSWGGYWGISAGDVDAALKSIGEVETLYVRLNSPGGEATEGVAIANLLRAHPANVRVTVYGMAASAASYIAIAGDTVSMGPGSLMFVHDAINIIYGDAADLRKEADTLDTISDSIAGLYKLKAGGSTAQWRTAMHADTWYSAEAAVTAKLADRVGLDPQMPDNLPPVEDAEDDDATVIEIDVEISPAARAAARRFDLSMLPNAPAALAPNTPAEPPVIPPNEPEEADTMSDTLIQGLRERLGVTDEGIDEAGLLAALDESLAERVETPAAASTENETELALVRRELSEAQAQLGQLVTARADDEAKGKATEKARIFAEAEQRGVVNTADHPKRLQLEVDYDEAPAVVARILAERPTGSVIPVNPAGYGSSPDDATTDPAAGDNYWFPGARVPATQEG